jgi:hypothetical protein
VPLFRPVRDVIQSNINGLMYPCEMGEIEPHGWVARYQAGMIFDGWPCYQWDKIDPRTRQIIHGLGHKTPDDIGRFMRLREGTLRENGGVLRDPLHREREAAHGAAPVMWAMLQKAGLARSGDNTWPIPTELGTLWRARTKNGRPGEPIDVGLEEMLPPLERFLNDDLGDYGQLCREPIDDQRVIWSLDLADRQTRNRDAASTGFGLVVGKYSIGDGRVFWIVSRLTPRRAADTVIGAWASNVGIVPTLF